MTNIKRTKKKGFATKTRYMLFSLLALVVVALPVTVSLLSKQQNNKSFASANFTPTSGRPYADNSPFNDLIGSNVVLDPNSASMVTALKSGSPVVDLYEFGTPIFFADANTPKYTINCIESWGTCALEGQQVPIPAGAQAAPGSDGQMVIVDLAARKSYDFWQYKNDHANTSWGAVIDIDGPGYDNGGNSAVGAGTSRLAGIVRTYEIEQGDIEHALVFSTNACGTAFRSPAQKTDGHVSGASSVPEGARVQLDPSVDCDSLSGAGTGEKAVCRAMQRYGAYSIDCGGASMALQFENPIGKTDPYPTAGLAGDYYRLSHIPWDKLRVLNAWNSYTPVTMTTPLPTATAGPVATATLAPTATAVPPTPTPTKVPTPTPNARDTQAPTAPSNLRSTSIQTTSIALAWNKSTDNVGVTRYEIWRGDSNYANWVLVGTVTGSTLQFTNTALPRHTTYTYGIRAFDAAGNKSAGSNGLRLTTQ